MMSLWDALRMNMMISYQELVRTFPKLQDINKVNKDIWEQKKAEEDARLNRHRRP